MFDWVWLWMVCWWCIRRSVFFLHKLLRHTHMFRVYLLHIERSTYARTADFEMCTHVFFAAMHFMRISFIPFRLFCLTPIEAAERCSTWHSTHFFSRRHWAADSGSVTVKGYHQRFFCSINCVTKNSCSLVRFHFLRFFYSMVVRLPIVMHFDL